MTDGKEELKKGPRRREPPSVRPVPFDETVADVLKVKPPPEKKRRGGSKKTPEAKRRRN